MKRFKFLLSLFIIGLVSWGAYASGMRDYVCIVRSNFSEKNKEFLTSYKNTMVSHGYNSFGKYIDEYLKGTFGSGFVYAASNGKFYVITNRHVISSAETATVQFEKDDGTYTEYEKLKILGVDDDLDIAVIELPSSFKGLGLSFRTKKVQDGDEVYTAGFPGLGENPVWQLGKGSVTNSSARIKELIDPSISTLIQHSGQVDGGNSGGPLLVSDSNYKAGYSVVGVNTWKAISRENTNFAIPGGVVKTSVDKIISSKGNSITLAQKLEKFNASIKNEEELFSNMSRYISNDMTANLKGTVFMNILKTAKGKSYDAILVTFANDPIEGVKYALAYYIYYKFRKSNNLLEYQMSEAEKVENGYKVTFTIGEKTFDAIWFNENGSWVIKDFDNVIANGALGASNGTQNLIYNPYSVGLDVGYSFSEKKGVYINGFMGMEKFNFRIFYRNDVPDYDSLFGFGYKFLLPLNFGPIIVEPSIAIDLCFGKSNSYINSFDSSFFRTTTLIGATIVANVSDSMGIAVGADYVLFNFPQFASDESQMNFWKISAGIYFGNGSTSSLW